MLRDGPPGNWHADGTPTGAPANARWKSWASIASFRASSTIEYFSPEMIGHRGCVNTIASLNHLATSKVTFWCGGTLWSPLAIGWGTFWSRPAMGSGNVCMTSDLCDMLMVDFWHLNNGGAMAPTGCRRFRRGVWRMTVSGRPHFYGSGTLVVHIVLTPSTWSGCRASWRVSKSSSLISDEQVVSPGSLLWSLLSSQSV